MDSAQRVLGETTVVERCGPSIHLHDTCRPVMLTGAVDRLVDVMKRRESDLDHCGLLTTTRLAVQAYGWPRNETDWTGACGARPVYP